MAAETPSERDPLLLLAGALAAGVGTLALAGWASLRPGWVAMAPRTALAFLLSGAALAAAGLSSTALSVRLTRLCALLAGGLGALTVVEYFAGLERLLLPGAGRMAVETAACFIILAAALCLKVGPSQSGQARRTAGALGLLAATIGLTALIVMPHFGVNGLAGRTSMAVQTAVLFVILGGVTARSVRRRPTAVWALDSWTTSAFSAGLVIIVFIGLYASATSARLAESDEVARFSHWIVFTSTAAGLTVFLLGLLGLEHAAAQRKRSESESRLLWMAIEQSHETVVITDAEARIQYVNPAFERTTGYTRAEAIGRKPSILKSGVHDRAFYEELWGGLARGEAWSGRIINRRKDGTLYEEPATINPVRDADGSVTNYIAVKRDDSKERALQEQFLQAQKMEAVGRLAGGIAHDFNNLLTGILGSAELLGPVVAPGSAAASDVEAILDAGRRAAGLTRQLLSFSRRQTTEMVTLDLQASVRAIETLLKRTLSEDLTLSLDLPKLPVWIKGDAGQVGQVLLNLCVNARDAMAAGGSLTISVSTEHLAAPRVARHDTVAPGPYALLRVADTGVGMTEAVLEHILEPFFTTKGLGTGLGLSTVYGIVKQCEGYLCVESAPGRGSVFDLYFPLAAAPASVTALGAAAGAPAKGGETVLVVEDDERILSVALRTLKSQGYTVLTSRSAEEAFAVEAAHRGEVHLLLTDVVMPGLSGPELARDILARRPKTKLLFMSGYADGLLESSGKLPAGTDLLHKPFELSELCARVRRALDA